jgi:hypothetical protein
MATTTPSQVAQAGMFSAQGFTLSWSDQGNSTKFVFEVSLPSAGATLSDYYISFAFSNDNFFSIFLTMFFKSEKKRNHTHEGFM